VSALWAVMYREGKIRATNALFIFWDVVYPLGYLLVFGVGMNNALGFSGLRTDYHASLVRWSAPGVAAKGMKRICSTPATVTPAAPLCRASARSQRFSRAPTSPAARVGPPGLSQACQLPR
jgi:hypothetical protein